jgi:uncharacterized protein YbjT (DUF2867 family)
MKKILITGATGLIGKQVVAEIAGLEHSETHILVRKAPARVPLGVTVHAFDPAEWGNVIAAVKPDVAISCLGTTMRTAGSKEAFRAVDFELVVAVAKAARIAGARQMIAVSSVGASAKGSNFYLKTKGEAEDAMTALDFERLDLLRPGLLTGGERSDSRPGERIGILLSPFTDLLMVGNLSRYRSIPSAKVAQAAVTLALCGGHGRHIHENDAILALAG